jgi:hypothetical protein
LAQRHTYQAASGKRLLTSVSKLLRHPAVGRCGHDDCNPKFHFLARFSQINMQIGT